MYHFRGRSNIKKQNTDKVTSLVVSGLGPLAGPKLFFSFNHLRTLKDNSFLMIIYTCNISERSFSVLRCCSQLGKQGNFEVNSEPLSDRIITKIGMAILDPSSCLGIIL